jgi:hypothetical protein
MSQEIAQAGTGEVPGATLRSYNPNSKHAPSGDPHSGGSPEHAPTSMTVPKCTAAAPGWCELPWIRDGWGCGACTVAGGVWLQCMSAGRIYTRA